MKRHQGDRNKTDIRMDESGFLRLVKPFTGCIVCDDRDEDNPVMGIILRVNEKSVSGLFLEGEFDTTYRYCNLVKVKTKRGFSYRSKTPLGMCGYIDGELLQEAIDKAETGIEFGSGEYSPN